MGNKYSGIRKDNHIQFYDNTLDSEEVGHQFLVSLFSNIWHIGLKNYTDKQWRNRFHHIKSCTTTELSFKYINAPEVLPKIIHIQFTHLTTLKLTNVCIKSIQPIIYLKAPNLQSLQISEQAFMSADFFSQCNFKNQMHSIIIFNAKTKTMPENYNWVFKIKTKALHQFEYYNTQIIRNTRYNDMARRRFPMAKIKLRYDTL